MHHGLIHFDRNNMWRQFFHYKSAYQSHELLLQQEQGSGIASLPKLQSLLNDGYGKKIF